MSVFFTVNIAAHGFRWKRVILTGLRPAEDRGSFNEWDTLGTDTNTGRGSELDILGTRSTIRTEIQI